MPETVQEQGSETITFVKFSLSSSAHPFVAASMVGGRTVMEELIPRGGARFAEYLSIVGTEPEAVMAVMENRATVEVQLHVRREDSGIFEFLTGEECPVVFLCLIGAVPRQVESTDGRGRITAEVPPSTDPSTVIRRFLSVYPDAELEIKRQQTNLTPRFGPHVFPPAIDDLLTDRQHRVMVTAFEEGFYDWPRVTTGEELAKSIGISPSTFHQHLRAAERHLVDWFLQNRSPQEGDESARQTLLEQ